MAYVLLASAAMMRAHLLVTLLAGPALLAACATDDATEDGADDAFITGKADGGIDEGSWQALSALKIANTIAPELLSRSVADGGVGLGSKAKRGIIAFRNGEDGTPGTSDDRTFGLLAQLDRVPYVGPVSLQRLIDYAVTNGLAVASGFECQATAVDPSKPNRLEGTWNGRYDEWELTITGEVGDYTYFQECSTAYSQPMPGITRYGCFYEPEWTFFEPANVIRFPEDVRDRADAFTITLIDVERDGRYHDGYREVPGTELGLACQPTAAN